MANSRSSSSSATHTSTKATMSTTTDAAAAATNGANGAEADGQVLHKDVTSFQEQVRINLHRCCRFDDDRSTVSTAKPPPH